MAWYDKPVVIGWSKRARHFTASLECGFSPQSNKGSDRVAIWTGTHAPMDTDLDGGSEDPGGGALHECWLLAPTAHSGGVLTLEGGGRVGLRGWVRYRYSSCMVSRIPGINYL